MNDEPPPAIPHRLAMLRVLNAVIATASESRTVPTPKSGIARPLSVLLIVALNDELGLPTSLNEIQSKLNIAQSSTSRCLYAFARRRILSIVRVEDGRRTYVRLAPKGREYVETVLSAMHRVCLEEGFVHV